MRTRRGFTFIEMSVAIVVLTILAMLVVPNVVKMQETTAHQSFFSSLYRLAGRARELAISEKSPMALTLDSEGRRFRITEEQDLTAADQQSSDDQERDSLSIPDGIETGEFSGPDDATTSSDWTIRFYPDGSSDGGGLEVTDNGRAKSLQIKPEGTITMINGNLPDQPDDKWPAGDFEHRA